jgi:hypothetical protein
MAKIPLRFAFFVGLLLLTGGTGYVDTPARNVLVTFHNDQIFDAIFEDDPIEMFVTAEDIHNPIGQVYVWGTTTVEIYTNHSGSLHCPMHIQLAHEDYPDEIIENAGVLVTYHIEGLDDPDPVGDEWQFHVDPPGLGAPSTLTVSVGRDWTVDDRAGNYTGTIYLTFYPD